MTQVEGAPSRPEEYEALAGMGNTAVSQATGRTWSEWATYLDDIGAAQMNHRAIAAHIDEHFDCGGWWAQTVTVAYERFRGLRDVGQRRGGGYDVNKSKTVPVPVEALWRAFADDATRTRWMGGDELRIHKSTEHRSIRAKDAEDRPVDVYFTAKGDDRSSVSVQHRGLPDTETADAVRASWTERLARLKELLTG